MSRKSHTGYLTEIVRSPLRQLSPVSYKLDCGQSSSFTCYCEPQQLCTLHNHFLPHQVKSIILGMDSVRTFGIHSPSTYKIYISLTMTCALNILNRFLPSVHDYFIPELNQHYLKVTSLRSDLHMQFHASFRSREQFRSRFIQFKQSWTKSLSICPPIIANILENTKHFTLILQRHTYFLLISQSTCHNQHYTCSSHLFLKLKF